MNILSDFRSCSLAGSDSPDWFVGDNCVLEGIDAVYIDNSLELFFAYCVGFTLFELFQAFTDAQNKQGAPTTSLSKFSAPKIQAAKNPGLLWSTVLSLVSDCHPPSCDLP